MADLLRNVVLRVNARLPFSLGGQRYRDLEDAICLLVHVVPESAVYVAFDQLAFNRRLLLLDQHHVGQQRVGRERSVLVVDQSVHLGLLHHPIEGAEPPVLQAFEQRLNLIRRELLVILELSWGVVFHELEYEPCLFDYFVCSQALPLLQEV